MQSVWKPAHTCQKVRNKGQFLKNCYIFL